MKNLIRLFGMAKKYYPLLAVACIGVVSAAFLNLATPYVTRSLTALIGAEGGILMPEVVRLSLLLLGAYILRMIARTLAIYLSHRAAWQFVPDLCCKVYCKLQANEDAIHALSSYHSRRAEGERRCQSLPPRGKVPAEGGGKRGKAFLYFPSSGALNFDRVSGLLY